MSNETETANTNDAAPTEPAAETLATQQAAVEQATPQKASREKAPFFRAMDKIGQGIASIRQGLKGALRYDPEQLEPAGLIKTTIYTAGHIVDGIALSAVREIGNVLGRIRDGINAALGTIGGAFLLQPFWKPEWYKRPFHATSGLLNAGTNTIKSPINYTHGITDRALENGVEQANYQTERIPLAGPLIAKSTNLITRSINTITRTVKNVVDLITSPLDKFHTATAPSK